MLKLSHGLSGTRPRISAVIRENRDVVRVVGRLSGRRDPIRFHNQCPIDPRWGWLGWSRLQQIKRQQNTHKKRIEIPISLYHKGLAPMFPDSERWKNTLTGVKFSARLPYVYGEFSEGSFNAFGDGTRFLISSVDINGKNLLSDGEPNTGYSFGVSFNLSKS